MNTNFLYLSGLSILGGSLSYLVFSAMQYLNAPVSMAATESKPRHRFMGQILLAAGGFLIGGQLLQMHQDDMEIARKEQQTIQQLQQIAALKNNTKSNDGPIGVRPAHRPSRGQLTPSSAP